MKKTSKKQPEVTENQQLQLPMRWSSGDDVPTIYANQLLVSHSGLNEFYLVFGEAQIPMIVDPHNPPASVEVRPLIKIVVVPEVMLSIVNVLNANISNFLSNRVSDESSK